MKCIMCNDVEQNAVAKRRRERERHFSNRFLFHVIANYAHCDVLASTKRQLFIASATPGPLGAFDLRKSTPLSCVVLTSMLHGRMAWVF